MKQILLCALFVIAGSHAFSQIRQNQWLLGGSGSFSHQFNSKQEFQLGNSTSFSVSPDVGYFIIHNLALGGRLGFEKSIYTETFPDVPHRRQIRIDASASPFARYYFFPSARRINLLADASYNWSWYQERGDFGDSKFHNESYTLAAGPAFFLNPYSALEITVAYTGGTYNYSFKNDVGVNVGFQLHLGKGKQKKS